MLFWLLLTACSLTGAALALAYALAHQ